MPTFLIFIKQNPKAEKVVIFVLSDQENPGWWDERGTRRGRADGAAGFLSSAQ